MNERLDAILSEYEELWRGAALAGKAQARYSGTGLLGRCAVFVAPLHLRWEIDSVGILWACPTCGQRSQYGENVGAVARHLNDRHDWDWLDFANKFRDVLEQGMKS